MYALTVPVIVSHAFATDLQTQNLSRYQKFSITDQFLPASIRFVQGPEIIARAIFDQTISQDHFNLLKTITIWKNKEPRRFIETPTTSKLL